MRDLKQDVQRDIKELEFQLQEIDDFLNTAPEGCLKYQQRDGRTEYYYQYIDKNTGEKKREYIKKQDMDFAKKLAQKGYYLKMQPILSKELEALKKFDNKYYPREKIETFSQLTNPRRTMVEPLYLEVAERRRQWQEEAVPVYEKYTENLRFETQRGELVRSKSELILANTFAQYSDTILYKYERPLELYDHNEMRVIHPDFTLLNLKTGKITYWEHAGCMDDSKYVEGFLWKINLYIYNHILPGDNLIITYETYTSPLDMGIVKILVQNVMS